MVDLGIVILAIFLVLDFAISIWNAFSAGVTLTLLKGPTTPPLGYSPYQYGAPPPPPPPPAKGNGLLKAAAYSALGLAFAGMSYVMLVVLGYVAYYFGYLGAADVSFIFALDFLVLVPVIIGFGLIVTAQSIATSMKTKNGWHIAISVFNVFALIFDIAIYATGFRTAYNTARGGGRNNANIVMVAILAIMIALFITYAAYKLGVKKAQSATSPASQPRRVGRPLGI